MEKKTVLVTAIGSFSSDAVIRRLKELGYRVVGCDIYEAAWLAQSRDVDAFYQAPPVSEAERYTAFISMVAEKEGVDFVLPLIDVEVDLLNRSRALFGAAPGEGRPVLCLPSAEVVETLRDKLALNKAVRAILKKLPDKEREAVRAVPSKRASEVDYEKMTYPIVLKPVRGRSSEGLYRIYHEDQLGFAFACIEDPSKLNDTTLEGYVAQPLIKGRVVAVDVVRDRAGHVRCAAREELVRTPNGAGISVRVFEDALLYQVCERLADGLGIVGCVNFELIQGEGSGVYYFLECNPRFSGGIAFSELAGLDAVKAQMQIFEGGELEEGAALTPGYMARKYAEYRTNN